VPQDSKDEPASALLDEIQAEKERLIKEGKIKSQKALEPIKESEVPFKVPEGWVWCRLDEVCNKISDGFHHTPTKLLEGIRYISATHINNGWIDWDSNIFVDKKEYLELYRKTRQGYGDILVVNRGAGCGDAAIVDIKEQFCFQNAAIIGFNKQSIYEKFMLIFWIFSKKTFLEKFIQGGAQPMLSNKLLSTHMISLPPLSEQKRIVAKVDSLMALCDQLNENLLNKGKSSENLLNAVVSHL